MFGTFVSCWAGSALSSLHAPTSTKRSESTCSTAPQLQQRKAGMSRAWGNLLCCETCSFSAPWMCSTEFSTSALLSAGCTKTGRNRGWLQSGHCCTHHRLSARHGQGEHCTAGQEAEERWWGNGRPLPPSSAMGAPAAEELWDQHPPRDSRREAGSRPQGDGGGTAGQSRGTQRSSP